MSDRTPGFYAQGRVFLQDMNPEYVDKILQI
jgi:hypothetical protein